MLAACSGEENFEVQHPDGYDQVQFGVAGSEAFSRVNYISYNSTTDPASMGVWATFTWATFTGENTPQSPFNNTSVVYDQGIWTYTDLQYWGSLPTHTSSDYFAYMPHSSATFSRNGNTATITYPLTLANGYVPEKEKPLFCTLPKHNPTVNQTILFDFDQALCAYQLHFKLGDRMGTIRSFIIKSVKISGTLTTQCTLSRTYTWNGTAWTAAPIACTSTQTSSVTNADIINEPIVENVSTPLRITAEGYSQWGAPFCVVPNQPNFTPTFEVTYDVVVKNENNDDVVTRENVTSTIEYSNNYFSSHDNTSAPAGTLRTIKILIVPDHLYVLADADQTAGLLLIK